MSTTDNILKYTIYAGIAALLCVPLIVANSMFFPYITGKAFVMRIVIEIMFAAWVILAIRQPEYRPQFSWIVTGVAVFVGWVLVSAVFGVNFNDSMWSNFERMTGWITLLHVLALVLVVGSTLRSEDEWRGVWWFSLGVSAVVALISFGEIGEMNRVDATLGNPIYLAVYALIHIFIAGWLGMRDALQKVKENVSIFTSWQLYVYSGLVGLNLLALIFTQTRGALLGLLGGLFVTAVLTAWREREFAGLRKAAAGLVILGIVLVGSFFVVKDTAVVQENAVLSRFANISLSEGTAESRLLLWGMALDGTAERPVFGWGMGNFNYVYDKYYTPEMYGNELWFDRAHNVYFEWMATAGVPGLLLYLSLLGLLIFYIWRPVRKDEDAEVLFKLSVTEKAILTGLVVAYGIHNFFVFDNLSSYILFGLLLALFHARGSVRFSNAWYYQEVDEAYKNRSWLVVAPLVAILIWVWNVPGITQAKSLVTALQFQRQNPPQALEQFEEAIEIGAMGTQEARERLTTAAGNFQAAGNLSAEVKRQYAEVAETQIQRQIELEPQNTRAHVFAGQLYLQTQQFDKAVDALERANQLSSDKPSILLLLVQALREAGNAERAQELSERAVELTNGDQQARFQFALSLIRNGDIEEGKAILQEEFGTTTLVNGNLIRSYQSIEAYDELIPIMQRRLQEENNPQAYVSLAAVYDEAGQPERAIELLEEAKERFASVGEQLDQIIQNIQGEDE